MLAQPNRSLAWSAIGALFATLIPGSVAFARILTNTIDASAIVTDSGRYLVVTGPLSCTPGERAFLRVSVTQRSTGALAEGSTLINCTGELRQWEVHATALGNETFEVGAATAVASARTTTHGDTTDAHQWLVAVALVSE